MSFSTMKKLNIDLASFGNFSSFSFSFRNFSYFGLENSSDSTN